MWVKPQTASHLNKFGSLVLLKGNTEPRFAFSTHPGTLVLQQLHAASESLLEFVGNLQTRAIRAKCSKLMRTNAVIQWILEAVFVHRPLSTLSNHGKFKVMDQEKLLSVNVPFKCRVILPPPVSFLLWTLDHQSHQSPGESWQRGLKSRWNPSREVWREKSPRSLLVRFAAG